MAKGFGKFKKLIKKVPVRGGSSAVVLEKDDGVTPSTTPEPAADALPSVDAAAGAQSPPPQDGAVEVIISTDADDVLDGILRDLNISQLAVHAEKADTVSEYSGGSAKSVSSEEETDSDEEETDNDDDEETGADEAQNKLAKKKLSSRAVGDKVSAVVAAAEEIRAKKRASSPPNAKAGSRAASPATSGRTTPATEPGSIQQAQAMSGARSGSPKTVPEQQQSQEQGSKSGNNSNSKVSKGSREKSTSRQKTTPSPVKGSSSSKPRKSPLPMYPKNSKKSSGRSTPQFSPEIDPKNSKKSSGRSTPQFSPEIDPSDQKKGRKSTSTSFDDDRTKETENSEEDDVTTEEIVDDINDGSNTVDDGTLGENTLGTELSYDEDGNVVRCDVSASESADASTYVDDEEEGGRRARTVMNKDIIIHAPGGPSGLVVRAMYYTPLPASPEDIIIKVEASTVSFRDCLFRRGIGTEKASFPFTPGCEVVGRISNAGKAARREGYRVGDRVVGMTRHGGGNGYYAKLTTSTVSPVLATNIDAADAVCLVDVYMTAYQALRVGKKDGTPLTDANVLITDGYSPVGQAAVALAKLEGANVYVTTTESRQDEYMKSLGVKCLPLAPSKWLHKIKGKMDIVIDNTCFDSYDSSWKALNVNGVLVCTGTTSLYSFQDYAAGRGGCGGCESFGDMRDYQAKWAGFKAKYMMSQTKFHDLWDSFQTDPKKYQQELKYLCFLVESGTLKPKIAERVSIEEIPDAQRYLETGKANGTIVCLP